MKFNREKFFDGTRAFLRSNGKTLTIKRVKAIEFLLTRFENYADVWQDVRHIAYAFSTIAHETAWTFEPITEYGSKSYFNRYDIAHNPRKAKELGNIYAGDGYKYRGRGYVQLTGRTNYEYYGIEDDPDEALLPYKTFAIMTDGMFKGRYTGKKLSDYINAKKCDYVNARRIINGTDKAEVIAKYAKTFEKILKDSTVAQTIPSADTLPTSPVQDQNEQQIQIENPLNPNNEQPLNPIGEKITVETATGTSFSLDTLQSAGDKLNNINNTFAPISRMSIFESVVSKVGAVVGLIYGFLTDNPVIGIVALIALIAIGAWIYNNAKNRAVNKQIATFRG